MSMPDHTDEPVAAAGGKVASYLSLATVAAEAIAQLAAARARERAVTDERTAAALRAQRQAAYSQARLGSDPGPEAAGADRRPRRRLGLGQGAGLAPGPGGRARQRPRRGPTA